MDNFYPIKTNQICTCGGELEYRWADRTIPGSGILSCVKCGNQSSFCVSYKEAVADFNWRHIERFKPPVKMKYTPDYPRSDTDDGFLSFFRSLPCCIWLLVENRLINMSSLERFYHG